MSPRHGVEGLLAIYDGRGPHRSSLCEKLPTVCIDLVTAFLPGGGRRGGPDSVDPTWAN